MLAQLYRRYIATFSRLIRPKREPGMISRWWNRIATPAPMPDTTGMDFAALDRLTSRMGDSYRGAGVAAALLGTGIIFCSLAPIGFNLKTGGAVLFHVGKFTCMAGLGLLMLYTLRNDLRGRWVTLRRETERLRYAPLRAAIDTLRAAPGQIKPSAELWSVLTGLLLGERSQTHYNRARANSYLAIERASDIITGVGIGIALLAAFAYIWTHATWLIFFTAFVPALIAALHGINGFLQLRPLAEDHDALADKLEGLADVLAQLAPEDTERLLALAELTYSALADRDARWSEMAARSGMRSLWTGRGANPFGAA